MNGMRKFVDTGLFLLTVLYAYVALALGAAASFLLNRLLARWKLRPKTTTDNRVENSRTTGEDLYLKHLRLRAYVLGAYQSDPYEEAYAACVEENYRPVEVLLPRHVVQRLEVWAGRAQPNQVALSDAVEQLAVVGLADDHLTAMITRPGWEELLDEEGWAP